MAGNNDAIFMVPCPVDSAGETDNLLWQFASLDRVRNLGSNKCIDANDAKTPILYPCYNSDNDNQEWSDPLNGGLLKNGRSKLCLDYNPVPERKALITNTCKTGARWTMYDPKESTEMRIYRETRDKHSAPIHG
jgi:hypothetical protein